MAETKLLKKAGKLIAAKDKKQIKPKKPRKPKVSKPKAIQRPLFREFVEAQNIKWDDVSGPEHNEKLWEEMYAKFITRAVATVIQS